MPVNCQKLSAVCVLVTVCACLFQGEQLVQAGGGIQCWPNPAATLLVTFEALGLARLVVIPQPRATLQAENTSFQSHMPQCMVLTPGEFNYMSPQTHTSHCRVLPPGTFNRMSSHIHVPHCRVLIRHPTTNCHIACDATRQIMCHDPRAMCNCRVLPSG